MFLATGIAIMPLHDWTDRPGWEGVRHSWIAELLRWIKPQLPEGLRAFVGTAPVLAIGAPAEKPDVGVRQWPEVDSSGTPAATPSANGAAGKAAEEPDDEVAVETLEPATGLYVARQGQLVAAVELISPRNKDRTVSRATYLARYAGYLLEGVHLLLVDVHRRPTAFSFADRIAEELQVKQPPLPAPMAVAYRVGEAAATGGRLASPVDRGTTSAERTPGTRRAQRRHDRPGTNLSARGCGCLPLEPATR